MRKLGIIATLLAFVLTLSGCGQTTAQISNVSGFQMMGSDGQLVQLNKTPEKIVVLSYGTAEIMNALGIPLAGIATTTRELSGGLENIVQVGIPMTPNVEQIVALEPDLVIMSSVFKAAQEAGFKQFGLTSLFIDNQKYSDTQKSIEEIAHAFSKEEEAAELLKPILEREAQILKNAQSAKGKKVMVLFGTTESFSMARSNSFVGEMVSLLGCENVTDTIELTDQQSSMVPLSVEKAVALNPDIILRVSHGHPTKVKRLYESEFASNPAWQSIEAVKNAEVYDLDTELYFANPGLKAIDSLEALAEILK